MCLISPHEHDRDPPINSSCQEGEKKCYLRDSSKRKEKMSSRFISCVDTTLSHHIRIIIMRQLKYTNCTWKCGERNIHTHTKETERKKYEVLQKRKKKESFERIIIVTTIIVEIQPTVIIQRFIQTQTLTSFCFMSYNAVAIVYLECTRVWRSTKKLLWKITFSRSL